MKVRGMNFDQYKISIETTHPLQVLYTKYNENDIISQFQSVRPLGRIRQKHSASSEYRTAKVSGARDKDMNLDTRFNSERVKYKSNQNLARVDIGDKEVNTFPALRRSKTQAFEEKFKIASRPHGESPSPSLRPNKSFDKKVVHLPLFKINLRTYVGEEEVSRTVAKTRESLRKLMDLNKAKMRNANVITANIKNYEFDAPRANSTLIRENTVDIQRRLVSQPFHAKPALRASRDREFKPKQDAFAKPLYKFGAIGAGKSKEIKEIRSGREICDTVNVTKRRISDVIGPDDEPDSSMLSLAIRPDTSLTLGTTMHQIDRVIKSPSSDELRELSEAFKNSDTPPAWPSVDDIQTLIARNQSRMTKSRTPFSRPTTVLNHVQELQERDFPQSRNRDQSRCCSLPLDHGHKNSPVLRYSSKQFTYKLDPVIVPSHTCTECPMCNIYQRDIETPGPPNTPNTSQFMLESDNYPVFVRGTKLNNTHGNQEILRVARINMDGYNSPDVQDGNSYMKTF